jgi:superfamily II DNA or RNA helicase
MARKPGPHELNFTNADGLAPPPAELMAEIARLKAFSRKAHAAPGAPAPDLDLEALLDALALLGGAVPGRVVAQWLELTGVTRSDGQPFDLDAVALGLRQLAVRGDLSSVIAGGYQLDLSEHTERLTRLLRAPRADRRWRQRLWLLTGCRGDWEDLPLWVSIRRDDDAVALLRLMIYSGMPAAEFDRLLAGPLSDLSAPDLSVLALIDPWLPDALDLIDTELRDRLLARCLDTLPSSSPAVRTVASQLFEAAPQNTHPRLRDRLAEDAALSLDFALAERLVQGGDGPAQALLQAVRATAQGDWADAVSAFERALKQARLLTRGKRGHLRRPLARLYVLALLAQGEPLAWAHARKFCIAESGTRTPDPESAWGLWSHVIGVKLGDEPYTPRHLASHGLQDPLNADRLLLAAWLGRGAPQWTAAAAAAVRAQQTDDLWLVDYLDAALARLDLGGAEPARVASFLDRPREAWRDALAAITALSEPQDGSAAANAPELAWQLSLDAVGRVRSLAPLEFTRGPRGLSKFKPVTLAKLKRQGAHRSRDNLVLRHIERDAWAGVHDLRLDVSQALVALLGHPHLMFAEAPGQFIELSEGMPELEVRRVDEAFEFHLHPPLVCPEPADVGLLFGATAEAERERRENQRVVREAPGRAKLIRITPTQRRVAELVAQGWRVPATATAELANALQVLTGHFQLHSDAEAGQRVAGDSRLRARLTPERNGLVLQLVAQPFGGFGPAVTPASGRARLMCLHNGISLTTERDLAAEAAHRQTVLDALPALDPELPADQPWHLLDPEQALAALETLPTLPAIAGLDWPKGKPVRVQPLASKALTVQISTGRDWLALTGEAALDEGRVVSLQALLTGARDSASRFVRLAEGQYLALSEHLRQQLRDLDALAQVKKGEVQLPRAASAWLERHLDEVQLDGDKPWRERLSQLTQAAALQPPVPSTLRTDLRAYQAEGFTWMRRLAAAGFGACLADDMGLGKTIQTLALLLARAGTGPALVLAPTSVCGNWLAECLAFAPTLNCSLYADATDRDALLQAAGPGDLIVASYALAQGDADRFARKHWATLVLDEAQALKNAATKRAQSVAAFPADFRLALSGTPVENRLSDLWSIMNLINPGLLGSAKQFNERFAGPIERQADSPVRARLRRLVGPFLLRRTKAQVLQDLPPRTEIVHRVEPSEAERHFLEALRRDARAAVAVAAQDRAAPMQVLAELMRLRRAACDPRLVSPELGLVGSKMAEFERIVRELVDGGHKALVFSQFTDYLDLLGERLVQMGVAHQRLDGSTPQAERSKRVAAFQRGEGEVFLISLKAGGFGLNLTAADYVLIVDPWWNPAAEDQASGRAHRMGQQRPVTVYRLVTAGSVEERIIELHRDKRGLAEGMLEGHEQPSVLDAQALAALLDD